MREKNPPILHYVGLVLLFVLAAGYQTRSMLYSFPDYFDKQVTAYPFYPDYANGQLHVQFVGQSAYDAGVRENDILVSVNGHAATGLAVFGETIRRAKPGDKVIFQVLTPGDSRPRNAAMRLDRSVSPTLAWAAVPLLAIKIVMPAFCILLGFWVAFMRPRDISAWLLCLIMLFFSVLYSAGVESWGPVVRDIARAYRVAITNTWPISMLLFGLYFPEAFPEKESFLWKWSKRFLISSLAILAVITVIEKLGEMESFASVALLAKLLDRVATFQFILSFCATGTFFASIGVKMGQAVTPDAKRRLGLLQWGAIISMTPACILFVTQSIEGGELEKIFPEWFVLISLSLMLLFPVTLAYVIVVHRAMDVRLVIRQGLQYALATNGVRVLQAILIFVAIWTALSLASDPNRNRPQKITAMAWGVVVAIWLNRGAARVRQWIDRRFFREAHDA